MYATAHTFALCHAWYHNFDLIGNGATAPTGMRLQTVTARNKEN